MFTTAMRRQLLFRFQPLRVSRSATPVTRSFQSSASQLYPRKDSQDKDSMVTESTEYSKSGSDAASAAVEDAAFSGNKTRPEEQLAAAEGETKGTGDNNPLDASPANHDISQPRKGTEGGAQGSIAETESGSSGRAKASGGGSSPKAGGGSSGGGGHM